LKIGLAFRRVTGKNKWHLFLRTRCKSWWRLLLASSILLVIEVWPTEQISRPLGPCRPKAQHVVWCYLCFQELMLHRTLLITAVHSVGRNHQLSEAADLWYLALGIKRGSYRKQQVHCDSY